MLLGVLGHRPDRYNDDQKGQRQSRKDQCERDFIRRLLTHGAFDESDHAIKKGLTRKGGDLYHDSIRDHPRPAGNSGTIAAGLADNWCGLARDRGLIDGRDAHNLMDG